ncbi:MAG: hypothetical protein GY896_22200 [Gammaproteobacteria bacterium]|nr:hypothetical protein [Gammaproteobacteria bacterium]MCP4980176.1 hypothetical protein [Gammaproteobacteria bacterium]
MSHSFNIKNSADLFSEFCLNVEEYRKDPMSSGKAVICAILAWHVVDWIFHEYRNVLVKFTSKTQFQNFVKKECPSLHYMQDIANGSKHRVFLKSYKPIVKDTEKHQGAFSSGFSGGFDVSSLRIYLGESSFVYFDEELEKVEAYITALFSNSLKQTNGPQQNPDP